MSTEAQISANQANAQQSTGPRTEAGKAASSQNSWKHGLAVGVFRVLASEDQFNYDLLRQLLTDEHAPTTPTEAILVERMAQHHWMRTRALHYQTQCLEEEILDNARLSLFLRYETQQERAFHKCLADLLKLRAEKQKQENGFASQAHQQEMRRLDLLCREQDVNYHRSRAVYADFNLECKQLHEQDLLIRKTQEAQQQKAA